MKTTERLIGALAGLGFALLAFYAIFVVGALIYKGTGPAPAAFIAPAEPAATAAADTADAPRQSRPLSPKGRAASIWRRGKRPSSNARPATPSPRAGRTAPGRTSGAFTAGASPPPRVSPIPMR